MRHFVIECVPGSVAEVVCCQPGPHDGSPLGYVIQFCGTWDGWAFDSDNHRVMRKVGWELSREEAVAAVVKNWNPTLELVGPLAGRPGTKLQTKTRESPGDLARKGHGGKRHEP